MTRVLGRSALLLVVATACCGRVYAGAPRADAADAADAADSTDADSLGDCVDGLGRIVSIRIDANGWVDTAGVAATAGLAVGDVWRGYRTATARDALMQTRNFRSVTVESRTAPAGCEVTVQVDRKPIVAKIELHGLDWDPLEVPRGVARWILRQPAPVRPPQENEVRRLLGLKVGALFEPGMLDRGSRRILEKHAAAGFAFAQVSTRTVERDGGIDLAVYVRQGPPVLVTQVAVRSDDGEARELVEAVLEEELGRATTRRMLRQTRRRVVRRLRESGYLEARVTLRRRVLTDEDREVAIDVVAGPRRTIEIAGNSSIDGDDLLPMSAVLDRVILTESTWRRFADAMRRNYRERGFYEAEVSVRLDDPAVIGFTVHEGTRYRIRGLEFAGNQAISSRVLSESVETGNRRWIRLLPDRNLSQSEIADDLRRLRHLYRRRGYESAEVSYRVDLDRDRGTALVWFEVVEGLRTIVRDVAYDGAPAPAQPPTIGAPLDSVVLEEMRSRWEEALRRSGYREAEIDFEVDRVAGTDEVSASIHWKVERGPKFRIGQVVIEGNSDVRDVVLRRDLSFEPGDPVTTEKLLDVQQSIYKTGVFRSVSVVPRSEEIPLGRDAPPSASHPLPDDGAAEQTQAAQDSKVSQEPQEAEEPQGPDAAREEEDADPEREVDIVVKVAGRPPGRVRYGLGYDTAEGFTGFGELSYANINRRAQRLRLRGQVGFNVGASKPTQYLLNAALIEPRVFDGPREAYVNALIERNTRTIDQFDIERFSLAVGINQMVGAVRLGLDLQTEYADVFDVVPRPFRDTDQRDSWTTALGLSGVYDGRDSAFDPRSGIFESVRVRYAFPQLSDVSQFEVDAQHTHLIPLWWDWTLAYSIRLGWIRPIDDDPIAPIRSRLFLGGGESVRGFAINSLGPYDGAGQDVGGDLAIIAKTEVRVPLFKALGLVLFVDAGGNYLLGCDAACRRGDPSDPTTQVNDAKVSFDNFRRTAGLGLRYVTPVGPISVDYGVKLDRRRRMLSDGSTDRESFGEFSISVGARF